MLIKGHSQDIDVSTNGETLTKLLPPREVTDRLLQIYINNLELTHRILHLPSFWAEYNAFWSTPHDRRPEFVALLLLILASTNCIENDSSIFRGKSSVNRDISVMWIRNSDSWLDSQSQKHITIATFQLHCLSFIAKQINAVKRKRTWTSAGNLMRVAVSAGLHRDAQLINVRHPTPSLRRVSVFDQEMRRRLWATIAELELQAAFERGMPGMMRGVVEDCGPPSNLEDEAFDRSTEQLPNPRPLSQHTRSSYQSLSHSSRSLRMELASLINNQDSHIIYEDVLLYDERVSQHLNAIPNWSDKEDLVSQILLQLQLRQFLLFLHRPYAQSEARDSRYDYSTFVQMKNAITILDLHNQLLSNGVKFLLLIRNDVLGAALSICYNMSFSDPRLGMLMQFE